MKTLVGIETIVRIPGWSLRRFFFASLRSAPYIGRRWLIHNISDPRLGAGSLLLYTIWPHFGQSPPAQLTH